MYRFWITKIFQTSILFEINKFHHGGPPWSGGPGAISPVAPPLIRPWQRLPLGTLISIVSTTKENYLRYPVSRHSVSLASINCDITITTFFVFIVWPILCNPLPGRTRSRGRCCAVEQTFDCLVSRYPETGDHAFYAECNCDQSRGTSVSFLCRNRSTLIAI